MLELAIEKTIPTSLPEKPHRRRHVQDTGETKENKEQNVQHAKDAIDARQ